VLAGTQTIAKRPAVGGVQVFLLVVLTSQKWPHEVHAEAAFSTQTRSNLYAARGSRRCVLRSAFCVQEHVATHLTGPICQGNSILAIARNKIASSVFHCWQFRLRLSIAQTATEGFPVCTQPKYKLLVDRPSNAVRYCETLSEVTEA